MTSEAISGPEHKSLAAGSYLALKRQAASKEEDFSLQDLWKILRRRQRIVMVSAAAFTLLALAASLYMTTKYEGIATLEVNKENSDMLGLSPNDKIDMAPSDSLSETVTIETEAAALQSPSLAFQVVQQLGLEKRKEFSLQSSVLNNNDQIAAEYKLPLEQAPLRRKRIYATFKKNLKVKPVAGTRLIEVHFLSPDPQVAADVANLLVKDLIEQDFHNRSAAIAQVSDWLSTQLSDLRDQVSSSQEQLNQVQKEAGILGTDETNNVVMAKLEELNKELTDAQANRILKQAVYQLAQSSDPEAISSIAGSSMLTGSVVNNNSLSLIQSLRTQEAELKVQYAQATAKFGPAYPLVGQIQSQLEALNTSIQAETRKLATRAENDYLAAKQSEDMLRAAFDKQKAEANRLNDKAVQYTILKQGVESSRKLYEDLLTKLKEGGVLAGLKSTNIVVLDPARTSAEPARPIYALNLAAGCMFGLVVGIVFAFVRDGFDNTVRTPEDVEATVAIPCAGIVPELSSCTELPKGMRRHKGNVLGTSIAAHPRSRMAEAYRALRTWILSSNAEAPPKVIMVTSALPREGKTTTSLNTAIALAQCGSNVLLLEADLRRPSLEILSNTKSGSGLAGVLSNPESCQAEFVRLSDIPNLLILPAGRCTESPAELLASGRMKNFINFVRKRFDFVVVDTPPMLSFTDATILSKQVDAVLYVVRSEQTTRQSCMRARDLMDSVNVRISGVLVNGANMRSEDYQQYYGYSGSNYMRYYDTVLSRVSEQSNSGGFE